MESLKPRRVAIRWLVPTAALLAGIAGGATLSVALADEASKPPAQDQYGVNAAGETYGSAAGAATVDEEPDLIEAFATNGRIGYVRRNDLLGPLPRSPDEAIRANARASQDQVKTERSPSIRRTVRLSLASSLLKVAASELE